MIKLNKVCFSYDGEHPVLVDFCMEIPDGGAIAVMGASGSGKTTAELRTDRAAPLLAF